MSDDDHDQCPVDFARITQHGPITMKTYPEVDPPLHALIETARRHAYRTLLFTIVMWLLAFILVGSLFVHAIQHAQASVVVDLCAIGLFLLAYRYGAS